MKSKWGGPRAGSGRPKTDKVARAKAAAQLDREFWRQVDVDCKEEGWPHPRSLSVTERALEKRRCEGWCALTSETRRPLYRRRVEAIRRIRLERRRARVKVAAALEKKKGR